MSSEIANYSVVDNVLESIKNKLEKMLGIEFEKMLGIEFETEFGLPSWWYYETSCPYQVKQVWLISKPLKLVSGLWLDVGACQVNNKSIFYFFHLEDPQYFEKIKEAWTQ